MDKTKATHVTNKLIWCELIWKGARITGFISSPATCNIVLFVTNHWVLCRLFDLTDITRQKWWRPIMAMTWRPRCSTQTEQLSQDTARDQVNDELAYSCFIIPLNYTVILADGINALRSLIRRRLSISACQCLAHGFDVDTDISRDELNISNIH